MFSLTHRESQIIELIFEGKSYKQIALDLGISEQTVKNHVCDLLRLTGANDKAHLVVVLLREGQIKLEVPANV